MKTKETVNKMIVSFNFTESWWENVKLKLLITLKLDSLVVAMTSVLFGTQLILFVHILQTYKIYTLIRELFDNTAIGLAFIILGLLKIIGIVINNRTIKYVSIRGLLFLWLVFFIAFLISPPPNTVWVYSLAMVILSTGSAYKEG